MWRPEQRETVAATDAVIAIFALLLCLFIPVTPGSQLASGVVGAVLHAVALGCSLGAVRYGTSGTRIAGWMVLVPALLALLAAVYQGYLDRDNVIWYWSMY